QIEEWSKYRDEFTDELARHKGLMGLPDPPPCELCLELNTIYRCLDCFFRHMLCQRCTTITHQSDPLHNIQKWTGEFFTRITLHDLGATYQLGHRPGETCAMPPAAMDLTLFDVLGITTVCIRYCSCREPGRQRPPRVQLLRMRWFPATLKQPGTAFTFRLLDFLHKLQTRSKINLYDVYATLISIHNASGLSPPIYSYNDLAFASCMWVDLRRVHRGGGAHIDGRFNALAPGSLAIDCPACPHPGKNLVTNSVDQWVHLWPMRASWVNTLYLSMDANFKLKQKERGFSDPPLSNGLAYMISDAILKTHLAECASKGLTSEV
ncbi:hypothetical protein BJ322DRAFT_1011908, partial [Thelephora terrestris]